MVTDFVFPPGKTSVRAEKKTLSVPPLPLRTTTYASHRPPSSIPFVLNFKMTHTTPTHASHTHIQGSLLNSPQLQGEEK